MIDALLQSVDKINENPSKQILKISKQISDYPVILVTGHRRENHGIGFKKILML